MKNKSGKWIWLGASTEDQYVEFKMPVRVEKGKKAKLAVSSEGHFAAYIDKKIVLFSQSAAYPDAPLYDECALTRFLSDGEEHELYILAWHPGVNSQNYISAEPGIWFELRSEGEVLYASEEGMLCRQSTSYKNGYKKSITVQLGISYYYDSTVKEENEWEGASVLIGRNMPKKRSVSPLALKKPCPAASMEITDRGTLLIDLSAERVGFLSLDLVSQEDQLLTVSYGEHLVDGHVPRIIKYRDFSVEYVASKGRNVFMHPLRRLACRYLEVEFSSPIEVSHLSLCEVTRRFTEQDKRFCDPLLQRIFDTSVNTLRLSVHEHYEDCPWREQCMYLLDSRNQMLCGYYAFRGFDVQRHNLVFFAEGQWDDGFFPLCFPSARNVAIPSFSLCFPQIVKDYVSHTGDRSVLAKVRPTMEKMLKAFASHIDESGLIPRFRHPFWNFYEWSEGSENDSDLGRAPED